MQTPVACFMSLETEEGKCRADLYNDTVSTEEYAHYRTFLGSEIEVDGASEPTDIIWENRHFTNRDYFFRQLWAFIIIGVLLAASVYVIYIISAFSAGMAAVFPPVDCDGVTTVYGDQLE